MMEEPEQPEGETPEEETPEGVPGEPGEATPAPDETPAESDAPGPEIEGLEELAEGGQGLTPEGSDPPAEEQPQGSEQPQGEEQPRERARPREGGKEGEKEDVIP